MVDAYFELVRAWVRRSRNEHTEEFDYHPCAPHESSGSDACLKVCKCGHICHDHIYLDGKNLYGPKPTAYLCVGAPECSCRMFEDKVPA